jgi:hypothetical protein
MPLRSANNGVQAMVAADVVVYASSQTRRFRNDQVALRRCSCRWTDCTATPRDPVLLPGGKAEGQLEGDADRCDGDWLRWTDPGKKRSP